MITCFQGNISNMLINVDIIFYAKFSSPFFSKRIKFSKLKTVNLIPNTYICPINVAPYIAKNIPY